MIDWHFLMKWNSIVTAVALCGALLVFSEAIAGFFPTASMQGDNVEGAPTGRVEHTATVVKNGKVLIVQNRIGLE
jgi:hypothetical protein